MGLIRTRLVKPTPLELPASASEREVLERVGGGQPVTLSNLELWRARCKDGGDAQVLERVHASLFEAPLKARDVEISAGGVRPVGAESGLALSSHRLVEGAPPEVAELRELMPEGLWGQAGALEAFARARADGLSSTRRTPSLLVLGGELGQGKLEALSAFEELLGQKRAGQQTPTPPRRVEVDLSAAIDGMVPALFGNDGAPLNLAALEKATGEGNVLVVLKNPANLAQNAPKVATALNDLLNTDARWVKRLYVVADFDGVPDAHAELGKSLGSPGVRQISAVADFGKLDAPAMLRYADELLPKLLANSRLEKLNFVFDPGARAVLGRVLATPNEPLDDLQPRLQQFVLSHVDVQTSFDPQTSVLKLSLAPELQADPKRLEALVTRLHRPLADLGAGRQLFVAAEVATRPDVDDTAVDVAWGEATAALRALREKVKGPSMLKLVLAVEAMARQTDSARSYGWADRITHRQYQSFVERAEVVGQELFERYEARLRTLPGPAELQADAELASNREVAEVLLALQTALAPIVEDDDSGQFVGQRLLELMAQLDEERQST